MSLRREAESSLREAQRDLATSADEDYQVFSFNDVEYACAPSMLRRGTAIAVGGNEEIVGISLMYLVVDFEEAEATEPVSGQKVTYQGAEHRVLTVERSPDGSYATLVCAEPNSNRRT
jgi:hypothetical protein